MSAHEERALVLIGPMGAGKTSIGRRVARILGTRFIDTDKVIAAQHGPIAEIFETHGEAHFRALEREAVAASVADGGVVALGGGAVLDVATQERLGSHLVGYLTVSRNVVATRIQGATRPLLNGDDPLERWDRIFAGRRGTYEALADATFDTSSGPLSEVVNAIVTWAQNENWEPPVGSGATDESPTPKEHQ